VSSVDYEALSILVFVVSAFVFGSIGLFVLIGIGAVWVEIFRAVIKWRKERE
jgi:hypothetical protein